ncbi:MAG: zf-HC2 domain-containing protein [bacterium]
MTHDADRCREIVRQLWPYLDGALPDEWQARVVEHLESCDACRSHYDFERAFLDAVRNSGALDRDVAPLRRRVVAALQGDGMA